MDQLRQMRTYLQSGLMSPEDYEKERVRIINELTRTVPRAAAGSSTEDQKVDPFATPFNPTNQVVVQVTEIQPSKGLPEGWHLGEDGRHYFLMQKRVDGRAYVDPAKFRAQLHRDTWR